MSAIDGQSPGPQNNASFARTGAKDRVPEIPFIPNKQVYILTCIDPRVDPAQIFGLELGDAIVARTVGGRVTPAVIQDLAWISYLHETKTPDVGWFELAVMHYTECGSGLFADDDLRHGCAARGFDEAELAGLAVLDPAATVPGDVEKIINAPQVSPRIKISGYSYDVKTGLVTTIVPPRSRQDSQCRGVRLRWPGWPDRASGASGHRSSRRDVPSSRSLPARCSIKPARAEGLAPVMMPPAGPGAPGGGQTWPARLAGPARLYPGR